MEWEKAARRMLSELKKDLRNHRMLADPWRRAIHSMLQSWRIQASQSRPRAVKTPRPCHDWNDAIKRMRASLDARAREQAMRGTWEHWAAHRPPPTLRYIAKAKRRRQRSGSCVPLNWSEP